MTGTLSSGGFLAVAVGQQSMARSSPLTLRQLSSEELA